MTLPRTAAEVLSGHVMLEVRCIDRVMLTFRQPRLQYGQGICNFFCQHRGNRFVSSALMLPMTARFGAGIRHYVDTRRLDLVRFTKGQSKDQVAKEYLAGHHGGECILFAGVAQEKNRVWRTAQRRDRATGKRYPWLYQEPAMAGHWYFYGSRRRFRPVLYHWCFALLRRRDTGVSNLFLDKEGCAGPGMTRRRERGSIGGVHIRLVLRRSADASWTDPTGLAGRAAGGAAPVFHRAVVRDVLRASRGAGGPGAPPHGGGHAAGSCRAARLAA